MSIIAGLKHTEHSPFRVLEPPFAADVAGNPQVDDGVVFDRVSAGVDATDYAPPSAVVNFQSALIEPALELGKGE